MAYALVANSNKDYTYHIYPSTITNHNSDKTIIDIKIEKAKSNCNKIDKNTNFKNLYLDEVVVDSKSYKYYHNYSDVCYFEDKNTARIVVATLIGKNTCGICVSTLYNAN